MTIEKKPFTDYNESESDPMRMEGKKKDDIIRIRLSHEDRKVINEMRKLLDVKSEGKAYKYFSAVGYNVLLRQFGKKNLKLLFKKDRARLSDFYSFE